MDNNLEREGKLSYVPTLIKAKTTIPDLDLANKFVIFKKFPRIIDLFNPVIEKFKECENVFKAITLPILGSTERLFSSSEVFKSNRRFSDAKSRIDSEIHGLRKTLNSLAETFNEFQVKSWGKEDWEEIQEILHYLGSYQRISEKESITTLDILGKYSIFYSEPPEPDIWQAIESIKKLQGE